MVISDGFEHELAREVLALCYQKQWRIAVAESCTGGLLSAAITEISGSSDVFDRGFITYSNRAKTELLGVAEKSLDVFGAVSEQVAREMAEGALQEAKVDLAVSITGVAGPGGSDHKPEGRICFGLAVKGVQTQGMTHDFGAIGRRQVRAASVVFALNLLTEASNA
ncbi:MAG: CinA family protein [Rhodobacteraceae bacterium]|nr:CinA family protein [Paracoccaceae bacterium]